MNRQAHFNVKPFQAFILKKRRHPIGRRPMSFVKPTEVRRAIDKAYRKWSDGK